MWLTGAALCSQRSHDLGEGAYVCLCVRVIKAERVCPEGGRGGGHGCAYPFGGWGGGDDLADPPQGQTTHPPPKTKTISAGEK